MDVLRTGGLILGTVWSVMPLRASSIDRPNVLLIISDDAGYADFGMQGGTEIPTPNIDALAAGGVRFTQGYVSSSVCAPSRTGLMTGRCQSRFGSENNLPSWSVLGLPKDEVTIAEFLKPAGYCSYAVGKWHLGHTEGCYPTERGFDHFYGFLGGSRTYFRAKYALPVDQKILEDKVPVEEEDWYLTDRFADRAVQYFKAHRVERADQPFFMYLAFNAPHSPMQADEKNLALAASLGIEDETRRTYAAMLMSLDQNIGKVLAGLKENGFAENTLVVYLNDNGGATWDGAVNTPLRGGKNSFFEGGIRVPFVMNWPGRIAPGQVIDTPVISLDLFPTFADAAGQSIPESLQLDGLDLMPLLTGKTSTLLRDELFWRIRGTKGDVALRKGNWVVYRMGQWHDEIALFNLATDPSEKVNLAKSRPEKLQEMLKRMDEWNRQMEPPRFWWSDEMYEKYKTEQTPEPR